MGMMAKGCVRTVLFLCTGNYFRSRFAEILFNSVASKMGLPWQASSRGLALERGRGNVGPIAPSVASLLGTLGIRAPDAIARIPLQVVVDDLEGAHFIVGLKEDEHLPLLQERFPAWANKVEYWSVDDAPEALALIEREVMSLTARMISGGNRQEPALQADPAQEAPMPKKETKTNSPVVRVGRETKGRRGKGVTTVSDLPLDEAGLLELAAKLKQRCG